MLTTVLGRVGQALLTLLGGAVLVFALLVLAPGDPARRVLHARGVQDPSPAAIAALRTQLHLDDPLPLRFWHWLTGLLHGDLGLSWRTGRPVIDEFLLRLPATAILTVTALVLAVAMALVLALAAAARPGGWPDHVGRWISLVLLVVPGFLIGVLALDVLVVRMGMGRVISDGTWGTVFLPALVLALGSAATWSRVLRAGLLDAGSASYLRVSAARGASAPRRLLVHQLPNAIPAFLTMVGLGTAALLGGAPIVESVFTWPGIGRYTVQAIEARDMPVVVGYTMLAVLIYVVASLVIDLLNAAIDPRLRRPASTRRPRRRPLVPVGTS
ncbi:ABC transporter permease [Nakamurella leprariae]|uniref:ABC transporter permease n=1 Tax=Nakamurella leprariae TaxID=2803911 RepID=A0A938YBH0_9ACTN|nr:ABC transporter permease [Nakamurella leprariae]MBM9466573.1 ABC transporter permease [Nakamurella leprariae]